MFNKKIMCHEGILAHLYFNGDTFLNEICLIVRGYWLPVRRLYDCLLLLFRKIDDFLDNILVRGDPKLMAALLPATTVEPGFHHAVYVFG